MTDKFVNQYRNELNESFKVGCFVYFFHSPEKACPYKQVTYINYILERHHRGNMCHTCTCTFLSFVYDIRSYFVYLLVSFARSFNA